MASFNLMSIFFFFFMSVLYYLLKVTDIQYLHLHVDGLGYQSDKKKRKKLALFSMNAGEIKEEQTK